MSNQITMPAGAERIIAELMAGGYDAYIVGGCVRDCLLGLQPNDWDICTAATPEEVMRCCAGRRIIETGLKHGTVTIVMGDGMYEVTTFRVDGDYSDNRRPDSVEFVRDIREDLARRDFTMNAIAYNYNAGLVDPFSGIKSLNEQTISCVGDPNDRFNEDALRILRALRFAATYGFEIDDATTKAIHENAGLLNRISAERIREELCKLLAGENVLSVLLNFPDVITTVIPELQPCVGFEQNNKYHLYTVYDHIAHAVSNYNGDDSRVLMALLLHDIGKPLCYTEDSKGGHFHGHGVVSSDIAEKVLVRLRFDNASLHDIVELVLYHDTQIEPATRTIRRWLNRLGPEQFLRLMDVRLADMKAHTPELNTTRIARRNDCVAIALDIFFQGQCFTIKDLAINGHDVMALGVPEGKQVGEVLKLALDAVIDGELPNDRDVLLAFAEDLTTENPPAPSEFTPW